MFSASMANGSTAFFNAVTISYAVPLDGALLLIEIYFIQNSTD